MNVQIKSLGMENEVKLSFHRPSFLTRRLDGRSLYQGSSMNNEVQIYDNYLSRDDFDSFKFEMGLEPFTTNNPMPWYYQTFKVKQDDSQQQFTHHFYMNQSPNSEYFKLLKPLLDKINPLSLIRIKANLQLRDSDVKESGMHIDVDIMSQEQKTGIFYMNTNNGKTIFQDGQKVDSIENRMVIFPTSLLHNGTTHTDTPYRCVINLNWI